MRMFDLDVYVGTAFLNMYAKCINMDIVCQVLGQMFVKIVVVFLAMISRHADNGLFQDAVEFFWYCFQILEYVSISNSIFAQQNNS